MSKLEVYTIKRISAMLGGELVLFNEDILIKNLVIDSRTLLDPTNALFFAIKGRRDGHQFIKDAYDNGIKNFVISEAVETSNYTNANFIRVNNTLEALQLLTKHHRELFDFEVIGITGSNGKTIVKEWLYQLMSVDYHIVRSPKSYNSQIGVPLSVWQISRHHNLGIFEAGISTTSEMDRLQQMIRPTIGVLTNIKPAHDEGFENRAQKLEEKLKLFKGVNIFVYGKDDVENIVSIKADKTFAWSFTQEADLQVTKVVLREGRAKLTAIFKGEVYLCEIPFSDNASIENVVICWSTLLALGYKMDEVLARLAHLAKVGMRLQLLNGIDNCSVIDDSYSADISSLAIALDFLNKQNQHPKRTLILSDLQETGKADEELFEEISVLLKQKKVNRLIGVGDRFSACASSFPIEKQFFRSTEELLREVPAMRFYDETILVKGARKFGFERVVKRLAQKIHDTVLEINLNALVANLQFYKSKIPAGVKTMAMVKAFSYGSGSFEVANLLQYHKVDYLAVAFADEGIALRKAGISLPIMVMSPEPSALDAMVRFNLEPEIYSVEILNAFLNVLPKLDKQFSIHIKLDTGMHRLGFESHQIVELREILNGHQHVKVSSVFTHLVGSDDAEHDGFTQHQIALYESMYNDLVADFAETPIKHVLNTSGISRWSGYHFDMVRIGIGLYGFDGALPRGVEGLETVATLKTTISQVKDITEGDTIGYGRRGLLPHGGKTATVKIGYADGYTRAFGNGVGKMLVAGKLVPTIGSICMDMCMLDITGLDVNVGDEVIVFSSDLPISALASSIDTIPYEILTNISQRVKRVYTYE
jgi:alanine racemase